MPVQTAIQLRRGTAASWTSTNPTLAAGEVGVETDTRKIKIGDGTTAWASLKYANIPQTTVTTKGDLLAASAADTVTRLAAGTNETRLVADSAAATGLKYVADTTNYAIAAKGDLLVGTAADTVQALTAGSNGDTLVADSAATTGLRWQGDYAAGKNALINADFRVNQRGFTSSTTNAAYGFDRWQQLFVTGGGTVTFSAETFTAGSAPVAGYEAVNYLRCVTASQSTQDARAFINQRCEDVRLFAGQTVTVSFWAKANSGTPNIGCSIGQNFGSGGSSEVFTPATPKAITTSWARYSFTIAVPSISGKTIGTGSNLRVCVIFSAGTDHQAALGAVGLQNNTFDLWGVQIESGSVATAFQTATGTLQGELAACQRYYYRSALASGGNYGVLSGNGLGTSTTVAITLWKFPVTMRIAPTAATVSGNIRLVDGTTAYSGGTWAISAGDGTSEVGWLSYTHGSAALTQYRPYYVSQNNDSNAFVGWSAEL